MIGLAHEGSPWEACNPWHRQKKWRRDRKIASVEIYWPLRLSRAFSQSTKTATGEPTAPRASKARENTGSRVGKKNPDVRIAVAMRSAPLAPRIPIRNRLNFEFMGERYRAAPEFSMRPLAPRLTHRADGTIISKNAPQPASVQHAAIECNTLPILIHWRANYPFDVWTPTFGAASPPGPKFRKPQRLLNG